MGALDEVMRLKNQGYSDQQIISGLRQQGVSPREINDALGQAQIKMAVSPGRRYRNQNQIPDDNTEEQEAMQGMQPSIMRNPEEFDNGEEAPYPDQDNEYQEQGAPIYSPQSQEISPPQQDYSPGYDYDQAGYQGYDNQNYEAYTPSTGIDTNSVFEIAEQVFIDKSKDMKSKLENINEFKTLIQAKVENMELRLEKIEKTIDKLQISILDKIGTYTGSIDSIKDEMSMMQESLGKMFAEGKMPKQRATHKITKHSSKKTRKK